MRNRRLLLAYSPLVDDRGTVSRRSGKEMSEFAVPVGERLGCLARLKARRIKAHRSRYRAPRTVTPFHAVPKMPVA